MKNIFIAVIVLGTVFLAVTSVLLENNVEKSRLTELKQEFSKKHIPSVDHSKLPELQRKFTTPQEVTEACISCHTERDEELMKSAHWLWAREEYIEGRGITFLGKRNLLNNFCIGIGGSEVACTRCHAGFGWTDMSFDFTDTTNIDCMVCHDNSGNYLKGKNLAGLPDPNVDLTLVAQNVGLPKKDNCGMCHFYSGGGNNVKHGDLEMALFDCTRDVDVHMATETSDMQCVECHTAENHVMKGKLYSVSSMNRNRATCEQCHGNNPHIDDLVNEHTLKVDCKTCHIPIYAKVNATKMSWDWSKAGKLKAGKPFHIEDEDGNETYLSIKGEFVWKKNVQPEYVWFNGTADHYVIGDKVDTTKVIKMNTLNGSYKDKESKIIPVKIHRAKQIYDCQNKMIIQPKLYAEEKGEGGYWKDFDWDIAAKLGMESVDAPYSGNYCFVHTEMYWPVNHMVSTADKSVECTECHTRENSRLAELQDFYMPGRDRSKWVDAGGRILIILALLGVFMHGAIRIVSHYRRKKVTQSSRL